MFETIALRDGRLRFLDYHFERLADGCRRLGIAPPDTGELTRELGEAAARCTHGTAKIIISRGEGRRGYRPPANGQPTRVVGLIPDAPGIVPAWRRGIRVRLCTTPLSENPALAGMKTLNRLEQVLAQAEWQSPDIAEGLMQTVAGHVICGTMSNLFVVQRGSLLTPALDRCGIRGVMRRVLIEEATRLGIDVQESVLTTAGLAAAPELFVTNSLQGIGPITGWDKERRDVGDVTRALMAALAARGVGECAGA